MYKYTAVVVTYDRPKLLKKCLSSIISQKLTCEKIVIIDNGSKKATAEVIKAFQAKVDEKIEWIKTTGNIGGAGGFNLGIKKAIALDSEYVWIMDDDTIPSNDALFYLDEAIKFFKQRQLNFGFLASNVKWNNKTPAIMNIPGVSDDWNGFVEKGLVKLNFASFVSMLVPADIIKKVGYPIKDFFIWGDDVEYGLRISQNYECYFVSKSIVTHAMNRNVGVNLRMEPDQARINRYYFEYRNTLFTTKSHSRKKFFKQILLNCIESIKILGSKNGLRKSWVIIKGTVAGIFFHPQIEMVTSNKKYNNV